MARSSTTFQPGRSGNPAGRPSRARIELQELLDELLPTDVRKRIMQRLIDDALAGDLDCIKLLLAYTYGKPIDRKEISGPDGASLDIPLREVIIERPLVRSGTDDN